jgi:hypothetical protein
MVASVVVGAGATLVVVFDEADPPQAAEIKPNIVRTKICRRATEIMSNSFSIDPLNRTAGESLVPACLLSLKALFRETKWPI